MIHRGEVVEQAVRRSGYSITVIAQKIGKSRRTVYNFFDNPELPLDIIEKIGKAIHVDFTMDFPQLKNTNYVEDKDTSYINQQQSAQFWKDKYYQLLEEYNSLLKKFTNNH